MNFIDFIPWATGLFETFGYGGIFVAAAADSATVLWPTFPLTVVIFLAATKLNPILLGLAAGIGSAVGEMVGYGVGRGGKALFIKKYKKQIEQLKNLFHKWHGSLIIFAIGAIPIIPFDVMGLFAGSIGYDPKKFFIAAAAGKTVRYTVVALAGFYGLNWFSGILFA